MQRANGYGGYLVGGGLALLVGCAPAAGGLAARTAGTTLRKPVASWQERRDRHVVLQGFDYSCGAAALATLLRYYFGAAVDEGVVLEEVLGSLNPEEVRDRERDGLSLLDLKCAAERLGYQAAGLRLRDADLAGLDTPALARVVRDGSAHFVVLRGLREDRVFLADPRTGNLRMARGQFLEEWAAPTGEGVLLVLWREGSPLPRGAPLTVAEPSPIRPELFAPRRAPAPAGGGPVPLQAAGSASLRGR